MYASNQAFGGQRASIGRAVVLMAGTVMTHGDAHQVLIPATIAEIDSADLPVFVDIRGRRFHGTLLTFQPTTAENIEKMPHDSWTWPPRV